MTFAACCKEFKTILRPRIKVGLEATRHYSYNIFGLLLDNGQVIPGICTRIGPVQTTRYTGGLH